MTPTVVCLSCERASNAIRRHTSQVNSGLDCARKSAATEEQVSDFPGRLLASFNEAQAAFDAYCKPSPMIDCFPVVDKRSINFIRGRFSHIHSAA